MLVVFPRGLPTTLFYPPLDYLSAVALMTFLMGFAPAVGTMVTCTWSHGGRVSVGLRTQAALGAFGGSLLGFVVTAYVAWFALAPVLAALSIRHGQVEEGPTAEEVPPTSPHPTHATLLLGVYLLLTLALGILVMRQILLWSSRVSLLVLYLSPLYLGAWVVGAYLLYRAPRTIVPRRRQTRLLAGLTLHVVAMGPALLFTLRYVLPKVMAGDFVLRDGYTQTEVVDYTLVADPFLAIALFIVLSLFVRTAWTGASPPKVN